MQSASLVEAPVECMSRFLLLVSDREFDVIIALELCRELLAIETTNQLLRRYEILFINLLGNGIVSYNAVDEDTSASEEEEDHASTGDSSGFTSSSSETDDATPL